MNICYVRMVSRYGRDQCPKSSRRNTCHDHGECPAGAEMGTLPRQGARRRVCLSGRITIKTQEMVPPRHIARTRKKCPGPHSPAPRRGVSHVPRKRCASMRRDSGGVWTPQPHDESAQCPSERFSHRTRLQPTVPRLQSCSARRTAPSRRAVINSAQLTFTRSLGTC